MPGTAALPPRQIGAGVCSARDPGAPASMATAGAEGLGPGRARGRATLNVGGAPGSQTHVHRTGLGPWSRSGHHAVPQRIHASPQCPHMLRIMLCINMLRIMLCNDMPSHPAL